MAWVEMMRRQFPPRFHGGHWDLTILSSINLTCWRVKFAIFLVLNRFICWDVEHLFGMVILLAGLSEVGHRVLWGMYRLKHSVIRLSMEISNGFARLRITDGNIFQV